MVKFDEADPIMSERGELSTLDSMAILYLERNGTQRRRKHSTNKQVKYPVDEQKPLGHRRKMLLPTHGNFKGENSTYTMKYSSGLTSNLNPTPTIQLEFISVTIKKRQMWSVNMEPQVSALLRISSNPAFSISHMKAGLKMKQNLFY